jgi:hypothetical protein
MFSLPNLTAQCMVMDSLRSFTITLENVLCVCVCVCVNTAHNEPNSQTYAHLNHFQNKSYLKISVEGNLDRGNWTRSTHWTEINFVFYISGSFLQTLILNPHTQHTFYSCDKNERWAGHVIRLEEQNPTRRVLIAVVEGRRQRGRPKLRWEDGVMHDIRKLGGEKLEECCKE